MHAARLAGVFLAMCSLAACQGETAPDDGAPGGVEASAPVNRILGDRSYLEAFGEPPSEDTSDARRIATHLSYVEGLLRSRDVSSWPAERRVARAVNLDRLNAYWRAGRFPRSPEQQPRHPRFVDADAVFSGEESEPRICAVGHLYAQDRGVAAAEAVSVEHEFAYIEQIHDEDLAAWAASSGLDPDELAMIQPGYGWLDRPGPRPIRQPAPSPEQVRARLAALEGQANQCIHRHLSPRDAHPAEISVRVQVAPGGRLQSLQFSPGALSKGAEQCLAGVVSSGLSFRPFNGAVVEASQRWAVIGPTGRNRTLNVAYTPVLLERADTGVQRCAAAHLTAPRAKAELLAEILLDPRGKASLQKLEGVTVNEAFTGCVRAEIEALPAPTFRGKPTAVTRVFPLPARAEEKPVGLIQIQVAPAPGADK